MTLFPTDVSFKGVKVVERDGGLMWEGKEMCRRDRCAVVGYGLTEWAPLDNEPQAVPSRQREERQTVREKVEIPDKGPKSLD